MGQRRIDQKENGIISRLVTTIICMFVGLSILDKTNNRRNILNDKRGMLGDIIGGAVVLFVGFSLMGTISQELDNSFCGANITSMNETLEPNGATDSFGGGGATHFGGYDGTVKHDSWLSKLAPVKTDESTVFNGENCIVEGSWGSTMINIVPIFFALGILGGALAMAYSAFRTSGFV